MSFGRQYVFVDVCLVCTGTDELCKLSANCSVLGISMYLLICVWYVLVLMNCVN